MKTKLFAGVFAVAAAVALSCLVGACASWGAISAEEYFAIGMAYFDMGKYAEAEKWLLRARAMDKTQSASEYNLGRIAFETDRYEEAAKHFEAILKRDPENVIALKAAAYTCIKNHEIEKAEELYNRLLVLVPESADDGYNYALVLFAMEKYADAEAVLQKHEFALVDNNDVLLLYARTQKEQGKIEAVDNYAAWLANNTNEKVRYEYAQLLESHQLYARALAEYRTALAAVDAAATDPSKAEIRFAVAKVIFIADPTNKEGAAALQEAITEGFHDFAVIEELLTDERISDTNKEEIRTIIDEGKRAVEAAEAAAKETEAAAKAAAETAEEGVIGTSETVAGETDVSGETTESAVENGGGEETAQ